MKCEYCGGTIVEDQWNPFGGKKCMMCGRKPKTKETKMDEDQKTKVCSRCGDEHPATNEFFSKNKATKDGLEHWCKTCKATKQKDYRLKKAKERNKPERKKLTLNPGNRKHGNNGHARNRAPKKEMQVIKGSAPIMNSEQLFRTFRYTLAYEICDEVVGHINELKEKLASELHLSRA